MPQSTVGYEKRFNRALQLADEDTFVSSVLEGQPNPPRYFARMKRINREGPPPLASGHAPLQLHVLDLEAQPDTGVVIVDTRPADIFAGGHVPGTINIPLDHSFVTWAGWLLPYDRPLLLIADDHAVADAVRRLHLIGLDTVDGYWTPAALAAWGMQGHEPATVQRVDAATLQGLLGREDVLALDVREPSEVLRGALAGSRNLPLGYLTQRLPEVPRHRLVAVYCQSGTRSSIAASLLKAAGYTRLVDLIGGFEGWQHHQHAMGMKTVTTVT